MDARRNIQELRNRVSKDIIGQDAIIDRLLIGLLANGNLLVEGLPGLAKTRAIKSLSRHLDADLSRIQFTPDLLPSDVTGTEVYHQADGKGEFRFEPGPIFSNLILADEINRAPAKVQAALLEAMEERQVTVAGTTHKLPDLFLVMATQNPIEQEGTYPLPEAQMDRFLMKVLIGYTDEAAEADIIRLVRSEETGGIKPEAATPNGDGTSAPVSSDAIFAARQEIRSLHVAEAVEKYMVDLVYATRYPDRYDGVLKSWIDVGVSPRGSIGLDRAARAYAWMQGNDHVTPDDVRSITHDVFRHRITLSYEARAGRISVDEVIDEIIKQVAVA
jgi:MoxR-like ATPase